MTPSYYARNVNNTEFVLEGRNFDSIPGDAVGIFAGNNDNPLEKRTTTSAANLYDIVEKTDVRMRLVCRNPTKNHAENYLGGIVSLGGEIVYWTNETRPLPPVNLSAQEL